MSTKNLRLWYSKPAKDWEKEALPIGNGRLGAMFFGDIERERIQFNEETLFSGKPMEANPNAYQELNKIRELLAKKDYAAAQIHTETVYLKKASYGDKSDFGSYQNFGDLYIEFDRQSGEIHNYIRELDLSNAIGKVEYECEGKKYTREYLSSYPSNIVAIRLTCSVPGSLNASISLQGGQPDSKVTASSDGVILLTGTTGYIEFEAKIKVMCSNGLMQPDNERIRITNADSIMIFIAAATEYLPVEPVYKGNDYKAYNENVLADVLSKTWDELKNEHIADYQNLFNRVSLQLNNEEDDSYPTDLRITNYKEGKKDSQLEMLLFQYGRYLLISSSRKGTLPANLQGVWNDSNDPVWGSMFCYNINLNMNYWHSEATNLAECHIPEIEFIDNLRSSGRKSAKAYFNANGWFTAKKSDVWGFTQPYAAAVNGLFIGGSGWLCQDVWEHYNFNRDLEYLKNVAYPIMKECSEFYLDYLIENEDSFLVSSPSTSPEISFFANSKLQTVSDGCEIDHRIIEELFENCIKCCRILGVDEAYRKVLEEKIKKIAPTKIGRSGCIQEWYQDWEYPEENHRHLSHMYGVHPAQLITPDQNPELIEAAKKSMNSRGDGETGWSRAWKINIWARFLDGNRAYNVLNSMISTSFHDNLFGICPPFQIDANFGYSSGVSEMLIQSNYNKEIYLLPALPDEWHEGKITGLRARGNFTVDMEWKNGRLTFAKICGNPGNKGTLCYIDKKIAFQLDLNGEFIY